MKFTIGRVTGLPMSELEPERLGAITCSSSLNDSLIVMKQTSEHTLLTTDALHDQNLSSNLNQHCLTMGTDYITVSTTMARREATMR